jgi:hypothetical protein
MKKSRHFTAENVVRLEIRTALFKATPLSSRPHDVLEFITNAPFGFAAVGEEIFIDLAFDNNDRMVEIFVERGHFLPSVT